MKRSWLAVAVVAVVGLAGCSGISDDERNEVHSAVVAQLIPTSTIESFAEGDEAAAKFIDGMHDLAAQLTSSILDDEMCGSPAYEAGLASSPELAAAHDAGCLRAAALGLG